MCKRCTIHIYNDITNKYFTRDCGCYNCPECSKKKKQKLWAILNNELKTWQFKSLWTFTLSSDLIDNPILHYQCLAYSYQATIWDLKRNGYLDKHFFQKKNVKSSKWFKGSKIIFKNYFKYFKVAELHKSGFTHFHVVFNQYVDYNIVNKYFEHHVIEFCKIYEIDTSREYLCNANVSNKYSSKFVANYLLKYITKTIEASREHELFTMLYSKSRNIPAFFPHGKNSLENSNKVFIFFESQWRDYLYLYHKRTFPQNSVTKEWILNYISLIEVRKKAYLDLHTPKIDSGCVEYIDFFDTNIEIHHSVTPGLLPILY
jgi:hypothetical protein